MPAGKHTSVRVALAVPPKLHEQLSEWAESEGRPVASLCLYLVEAGLRQAQKDGIAPSIGSSSNEPDTETGKSTSSMNDKEFEEYYKEQYKDLSPNEEPSGSDAIRMAAIRASQGQGKRSHRDDLRSVVEEYGEEVTKKNKKEQLLEKLLSALAD